MTTIASLLAELKGDSSGLQAEWKKAEERTDHLGESMKRIGEVAVAMTIGQSFMQLVPSVERAGESFQHLGQETLKLQRETGATAEQASQLLATFERYGVTVEQASVTLGIFAKHIQGVEDLTEQAMIGGKGFAGTMQDLGLKFTTVTGNARPMMDVLLDVADKFKDMPDGVEKTAMAMQLFGRSGKDMILMLNQGREGIQEAMEAAQKYGLSLTQDNLESVRQFGLEHKNLEEAMKGVTLQMGLALMPTLEALAKAATHVAEEFNQNVLPQIQKIRVAIEILSPALAEIGAGLWDLATVFARALGTVLSTTIEIGKKIYEALSYLNPFAEHSPSLVSQVQAGVDEIMRKYGELRDVEGPLMAVSDAMHALGDATEHGMASLKSGELARQAESVAAIFGGPAARAFRETSAQVEALDAVLGPLHDDIQAQQAVVDDWKIELDSAKDAVKESERALKDAEAAIKPYASALRDAQEAERPFAEATQAARYALDDAKASLSDATAKFEPLKLQVDAASERLDGLKSSLSGAKEQLDNLTKTPLAEDQKYIGQLHDLDRQILTVQSRIADMKAAGSPPKAFEALQKQLERLQASADSVKLKEHLEIDPMREKLEQAAKTTGDAATPFVALLARTQDYASQVRSLTPQVDAAQHAHEQLALQYKRAMDTLAPYNDQVHLMETRLREAEARQRPLTGAVHEAQQQYDDAKATLIEYQDSLDEAKAHLDGVQTNFDEATKSLSLLKDMYSDTLAVQQDMAKGLRDVVSAAESEQKRLEELAKHAPNVGAPEGGNNRLPTEEPEEMKRLKEEMEAQLADMKKGFQDFGKSLQDFADRLNNEVLPAFDKLADKVKAIDSSTLLGIAAGFGSWVILKTVVVPAISAFAASIDALIAGGGVVGFIAAFNPISLLLGLLALDIGLLVEAWANGVNPIETSMAAWRDIFGIFKKDMVLIWQGIQLAASTFAKGLGVVWEEIKTTISVVFEHSIGRIFSTFGTDVRNLLDGLSLAWKTFQTDITNIWDAIKLVAVSTFGVLKDIVLAPFREIRSSLQALIDWINGMPELTVGDKAIKFPKLPAIPAFAQGGIVNRPTMGIMGEAGPEAIIPLEGGGNFIQSLLDATKGGKPGSTGQETAPIQVTVHITVQGHVGVDDLVQKVSDGIHQGLMGKQVPGRGF